MPNHRSNEESEKLTTSKPPQRLPKRKPRWMHLPSTYRQREVVQIAQWIAMGASGCVVGLAESGRTNLLTFLCHRADVLELYLGDDSRVTLISVDLFNLPENDLSNLYRTILHAFYWEREAIPSKLHSYAEQLYLANREAADPFLPQMATYDLLRAFEDAGRRVVLVLNRFDRFCATASPQMLNTLRGLRDTFKGTLSYIVGMLQEVIYLANEVELGDMYDILDRQVCWVGTMTDEDARDMLRRDVLPGDVDLAEPEERAILQLSGRFPGLIKTVGLWWYSYARQAVDVNRWQAILLQETSVQFRVERIWNSLTQEEQLALSEIQKLERQVVGVDWLNPFLSLNGAVASVNGSGNLPSSQQRALDHLSSQYAHALAQLVVKGLCQQIGPVWLIQSRLLAAFVETKEGRAKGRIWLDEQSKQIFQGKTLMQDITGLQHAILEFMIRNPRVRHTYDEIISSAWPDEDQREGISDNALQVHIRSIRKRIEPNPAKPNYLITWRGMPGGYIFYPEGRPE